jgi:IS1 family transposase
MSWLHIAYDRETQIFIVGFFGAMISLWPVCLLFLLPYDVFLSREVLTMQYRTKQARIEKDNEQLRLELLDHKAIIDALLKEQMKAL